ncbi:hypothetical protein [Mesorhizobium sp. M0701]|uniref:hypothetical protein n=1 Tax=Mesorhizobium sp. M0701 TaxID=2956989 RepID=UPI00333A3210
MSTTIPQTLPVCETICDSVFLPVIIRGEMPGRAMRGGADEPDEPGLNATFPEAADRLAKDVVGGMVIDDRYLANQQAIATED